MLSCINKGTSHHELYICNLNIYRVIQYSWYMFLCAAGEILERDFFATGARMIGKETVPPYNNFLSLPAVLR